MDKIAYFDGVTANLRANGGDLSASVRLIRDPVPLHSGVKYTHADIEIEILIPFNFAGKELACVALGDYHEDVNWWCYTDQQRTGHQVTAMIAALEDAIEAAEEDIATQIMAGWPKTKDKTIQKKTKIILKNLYESI